MQKIKLTKKVGPYEKDQIVSFDEGSAKQLIESKRGVAVKDDDEKPAQDA